MKKTSMALVAVVLLCSLAFGIGEVGAEMGTVTPTITAETNSADIKRIYLNNYSQEIIQFVDEKGKLFKQIELPDRVLRGSGMASPAEISPNKKYVLITTRKNDELSDEEFSRTGLRIKYQDNLVLYKNNGEVVYQKESFEYDPLNLADNGYLLAFKLGYEESADWQPQLSPEIEANPPKAVLAVFDLQLKEIFKKEAYWYSAPQTAISPNGIWLFTGDSIIRIGDKKMIRIPEGIKGAYFNIQDDGLLIAIKRAGRDSAGRQKIRKITYNPQTGERIDLGVMLE